MMNAPTITKKRANDLQIACMYTMAWYTMCAFTKQEKMRIKVINNMEWNFTLNFSVFAIKNGEKVYFKAEPKDETTKKYASAYEQTQIANLFINYDDVIIDWNDDIEGTFETFEKIYGDRFTEANWAIEHYNMDGEVIHL